MNKTKHNPDRPSRLSTRLNAYDYTSHGAYFVTICTDRRTPHFANPTFHALLFEVWQALPDRFPGISIGEFVIMPWGGYVPSIFGRAAFMIISSVMIKI
jgi:hypothetical protein